MNKEKCRHEWLKNLDYNGKWECQDCGKIIGKNKDNITQPDKEIDIPELIKKLIAEHGTKKYKQGFKDRIKSERNKS